MDLMPIAIGIVVGVLVVAVVTSVRRRRQPRATAAGAHAIAVARATEPAGLDPVRHDVLAAGAATPSEPRIEPHPAAVVADQACPRCGRPMVERIAKRGPREGHAFMACTAYPECRTAFELQPRSGVT